MRNSAYFRVALRAPWARVRVAAHERKYACARQGSDLPLESIETGPSGEGLMNAGAICQRLLITIGRSDEVTRAMQLLRDKHVGYLVVVEAHPVEGCLRAVGVLTDRDIVVTVVAHQVDPAAVRVGEIMTPDPVTIAETASIAQALQELPGRGAPHARRGPAGRAGRGAFL